MNLPEKSSRHLSFGELTLWSVLLIFMLLILGGFVGVGWYRLVAGAAPGAAAIGAGLFMGALGSTLVFLIASTYASATGLSKFEVAPLSLFLLAVSAMGTVNSGMLLMESEPILNETMDFAATDLVRLRAAADAAAATPEFDKLGNEVRATWAAARAQLVTEAKCGEGTEFEKLLKPLDTLLNSKLYALGGKPIVPASSEACKTPQMKTAIETRAKEYDQLIEKLLSESPKSRSDRVVERRALRASVQKDIDGALANMSGKRKQWAAGASTKDAMLQELDTANGIYIKAVAALQRVSPEAIGNAKLPTQLDLQNIKGLGQVSQMWGIIWKRWDKVWGYVAAALVFDWLVVWVAIQRKRIQVQAVSHIDDSIRLTTSLQPLPRTSARAPTPPPPSRVKSLWVPEADVAVRNSSL